MEVTSLDENGNEEYKLCLYSDATYDMHDNWVEDKQIYEYYIAGSRVSSNDYNDAIANSSLVTERIRIVTFEDDRIFDEDYNDYFKKDNQCYFSQEHIIDTDSTTILLTVAVLKK